MPGFECKSCGAKGFRSLQALGLHLSLACRGKAPIKRARRDVDNPDPEFTGGEKDIAGAKKHATNSKCAAAEVDWDAQSFDLPPRAGDVVGKQILRQASHQDQSEGNAGEAGQDITDHDALLHPFSFRYAPSPDQAFHPSFNLDAMPSQSAGERMLKEVRTENFDDERLLRFVRGCNNGAGLGGIDQAAMFSMFNKGFDPKNLHVKSVQQLKKYETESLHLEKDVS